MARARLRLEFDGLQQMIKRLEALEKDIKPIASDALISTSNLVTAQAEKAIVPHKRTGTTENSLSSENVVEWDGTKAEIKVGFNIKKGGLPSIFLMYGTPRIPKDEKLYNAFYGKNTLRTIKKLQEQTFINALIEAMEGK